MWKTLRFHIVLNLLRLILLLVFFSVFYVGTWKQLPYLFASHIMESIHFLRFKRKAGEKKGQKRHKLTLSHAHAHLTILKMHGLSLFFAIRFAVIECDFSSAKWYSSLLRAHLLNAVGFWLHILFAKWFTIWFIISIYFLLARTHTQKHFKRDGTKQAPQKILHIKRLMLDSLSFRMHYTIMLSSILHL